MEASKLVPGGALSPTLLSCGHRPDVLVLWLGGGTDLVLLVAGAAVPADCVLNHGEVDCDEAALTGESLPVTKYAADSAKMGSTVVRGETEATVEATGKDSFFGRTASMLQGKGEAGKRVEPGIELLVPSVRRGK
jgi:magnesium-transporting ATPase (P-type)